MKRLLGKEPMEYRVDDLRTIAAGAYGVSPESVTDQQLEYALYELSCKHGHVNISGLVPVDPGERDGMGTDAAAARRPGPGCISQPPGTVAKILKRVARLVPTGSPGQPGNPASAASDTPETLADVGPACAADAAPIRRPRHRSGRPPDIERRESIRLAIGKHGAEWRDHFTEIVEELDANEVPLGDFNGKMIHIGDSEPVKTSKWQDLDLADGKDRSRIIDAFRKYLD
jgi:hypothetical protein